MTRIGVLALQGAFAAHQKNLTALGHQTVTVLQSGDLAALDGLILPGGESSAQLKLLERVQLKESLHAFLASGRPVLAICAGLILLAREVQQPHQESFDVLDITVVRNGWGRQVHSFEAVADQQRLPLVFIRAPRITRTGPSVEVLLTFQQEPIMVRQGRILGATFHPELTSDLSVHRLAFG
jgi:5'-phosphate synthase pdxT subunit